MQAELLNSNWDMSDQHWSAHLRRIEDERRRLRASEPYRENPDQDEPPTHVVVVKVYAQSPQDSGEVRLALAVWSIDEDGAVDQQFGIRATPEAYPEPHARWWLACWMKTLRERGLGFDTNVLWTLLENSTVQLMSPGPARWAASFLEKDSQLREQTRLVAGVIAALEREASEDNVSQQAVGAPPPPLDEEQATRLGHFARRSIYDKWAYKFTEGGLQSLSNVINLTSSVLWIVPVLWMIAAVFGVLAFLFLGAGQLPRASWSNASCGMAQFLGIIVYLLPGYLPVLLMHLSILPVIVLSTWKLARFQRPREERGAWERRLARWIPDLQSKPLAGAREPPCRQPRGAIIIELLGDGPVRFRMSFFDLTDTSVARILDRKTPANLLWVSRVVQGPDEDASLVTPQAFENLMFHDFGLTRQQIRLLRDSKNVQWFIVRPASMGRDKTGGRPSNSSQIAVEVSSYIRGASEEGCSSCAPVDVAFIDALRSLSNQVDEVVTGGTGDGVGWKQAPESRSFLRAVAVKIWRVLWRDVVIALLYWTGWNFARHGSQGGPIVACLALLFLITVAQIENIARLSKTMSETEGS